ncbi:MAG: carboxypeptidase-like regulatory domain-containing protein [Acidobacteriota bacterium]
MTTGELRGQLTTSQGEGLPGLTLTLSGAQDPTQLTNEQGRFHYRAVTPGTQTLRIELATMPGLEVRGIRITAGKTTVLDRTIGLEEGA